ncbi:serine/threonine protein kinase, partial [Stieleria sp. ICT_E10.1]|uniref:serine/threonine protein kinase n=1 Tax=Stieleria sedimenti TaxID=2976331 RepID=UPI00217FF41E
ERVEELLRVHEQEQSFLKSNNNPPSTEVMGELNIALGQQIGRYKLLQKIGEGGFGVVFMAEQHRPVRRKVALKVIKPGMDTKAVVARFEAERQALAMMGHPNIARVFDGGATDGGRPYFVMELVKGVPITEYCDKNELSTEQRLKLFATVCQAVQHAHQKGIIHRDLKPSNVLVTLADGEPVVKVIDFGVAKATNQQLTEKTLFTAFGQMVGTPQYMSPEQAEMSCLDVDTRSDVYSLGVLLYELLTGTTPLEAERLRTAGYAEMQRLIREEEPLKPSTRLSTSGDKLTILAKHRKVTPEKLKSQVKGDLDWIVMKALEKDRNRRYESPASLGDDVGRVLRDEPVEACPPSRNYRLRKFIRRNTVAVVTASAITTLLVAATAISLSLALWAIDERRVAQESMNSLRKSAFRHGVSCVLNANENEAEKIVAELERQTNADDRYAETLQAILCLHTSKFHEAIDLLENLTGESPEDVGLLAMLTDAYDGQGNIDMFVNTHDTLMAKIPAVDLTSLSTIELIYVALANIAAPKYGYEYSCLALDADPGSHYARLIRGRMAASYVLRAGPRLGSNREQDLINQAIADVDSLRLLYKFDSRIPSQALATHLLVANSLLANGNSDWVGTLTDAKPIVEHLESRSRTGWEDFFLAAYYYGLDQAGVLQGGRERALIAYKNASVDDEEKLHDYASCYYIALACELSVGLDTHVKRAIEASDSSVYGWRGLGLSYVLSGHQAEAGRCAETLVQRGSVDAAVHAAEIYMLLGKRNEAIRIVNDVVSDADESELSDPSKWYRQEIPKFYRSRLMGNGDYSSEMLIASAEESGYPRTNLNFAYWAIAIAAWDSESGADGRNSLQWLKRCETQCQMSFPQLPWSRALITWIEKSESR